MNDQVYRLFPGDGLEIPSDEERARADLLVGFEIPRQREGRMARFADSRTNRAFMRSTIKRWCARTGREWL